MNHEYFMREALAVAAKAMDAGEMPIGAVLVSGNEILVKSWTKDKEFKQRIVHAEMLALLDLDKRKPFPGNRRDVRLYTNLEPCMMCLGACLVSDIGEIYYALESPTDGAEALYKQSNVAPTDHVGCREIKISGGILREESRELFRQYCETYPSGGFSNWAKTLLKL